MATYNNADEQLRTIKQSLRSMMNGVASKKMREAGITYKVNYGVELPRLQEFSREFTPDCELAAKLWEEDIRECRLLAAMLMPHENFHEDLAEQWTEQMRFPEEADCAVFHLIGSQPYASDMAFKCMADEKPLKRYVGYQLMNRLLMQGMKPTSRDGQEILDNIATDLQGTNSYVSRAASNVLSRYMDCGIGEERMAQAMLKRLSR